jgi:flagellar motor component MotA
MFIIGIAIFLIGIASLTAWAGGGFGVFIDPFSLLAVLVPLLAVLTATKSFKVFYGGLKAVIRPKENLTEDLRGQAASLFRLLSKTTALASGIGVLIGSIIALGYVESPKILGEALSVALITPLYGVILIAALFEPVVFSLKKRRDTERR